MRPHRLDAVDVAVRDASRESWRVSRRLRSTQVNLRQHYKRWTGRAFRMRAACQKYDVPQCNRRRDIIDGGRNHYHFLAGDDLPGRASVEYEATYRGVAANATQSSLRNFQLSLDAVFAPCDEATFEALKGVYGGWSASRSAVAWEAGREFRLSDLLPPLAQARATFAKSASGGPFSSKTQANKPSSARCRAA